MFDDIVIFIPGISGSVLTKHSKTLWAPQAGAALRGLFSGLGSIRSLKMDGDDPDLDDLGDGVEATGLCQDLHIIPGLCKIDGYTRMRNSLFERLPLVEQENYFELPYDWRRDNRVAARKLQRLSEQWLAKRRKAYPKAQIILVAHSMGGVIARIFLEQMEGWRDTRRLFTFGTPYGGSLNALDNLSNGFKMGVGVLKADLTETLSSFTSVYQLLPSFRCLRSPVDRSWVALDAPGLELPGIDKKRMADALAMHRSLRASVNEHLKDPEYQESGYAITPIVGTYIDTSYSTELHGNIVVMSTHRGPDTYGGDGTVPWKAAVPHEQEGKRELAVWVNEKHGSLQNNNFSIDNVAGILIAERDPEAIYTSKGAQISVTSEDARAGQPVTIRAHASIANPELLCRVTPLAGGLTRDLPMVPDPADPHAAVLRLDAPAAGDYRVTVAGPETNVVTDLFSVVDLDD